MGAVDACRYFRLSWRVVSLRGPVGVDPSLLRVDCGVSLVGIVCFKLEESAFKLS